MTARGDKYAGYESFSHALLYFEKGCARMEDNKLIEAPDALLYRFVAGHGRMVFGKTPEGEWAFMMCASAEDSNSPDYKNDPDSEDILPVYGMVINSPEAAIAMGEGLLRFAEVMRNDTKRD